MVTCNANVFLYLVSMMVRLWPYLDKEDFPVNQKSSFTFTGLFFHFVPIDFPIYFLLLPSILSTLYLSLHIFLLEREDEGLRQPVIKALVTSWPE